MLRTSLLLCLGLLCTAADCLYFWLVLWHFAFLSLLMVCFCWLVLRTSLSLACLWFVFAGSCFHFAFLSLLMICFCWLVLCTSPLVDFPLVSPCRSKKALAFLDCRAVALSDRNFKSSFVQAQQLLSFLSGTACSLRTLYPLTVSFTTLILSQHHLLQLPFHFNTTLISFSI